MVIQTDGLTKRFGEITAVDDLSMEVRRGHLPVIKWLLETPHT